MSDVRQGHIERGPVHGSEHGLVRLSSRHGHVNRGARECVTR